MPPSSSPRSRSPTSTVSAIAPAIIESCPTRLFLPNERAIEPQITAIYRRFGLNDRQIEILARATPKRDYYCQSRRGNRLFELGLGEVALAFCAASSKSDQAAIARVLAEHGREGFRRRLAAPTAARGWAADLIPDLTQRGDVVMIRLSVICAAALVAAVAVPAVLRCRIVATASAQSIVFDPEQLRAERADGGARAAADQQPDHLAAKPSADADQSGEQSREPAVFVAAAASIVDPAHPAASRARRSASPTTSSRSISAFSTTYGAAIASRRPIRR